MALRRKTPVEALSIEQIEKVALECRGLLEEKKGTDVAILDLRSIHTEFDFFIIVTGNSRLHCRSLARELSRLMSSRKLKQVYSGSTDSEWVILDYGDIVLHVFTAEARSYYNLEKLWSDAKRL